ncbi:MAG TPA: hypothetical protein VIC02_00670, partial [Kineobactrum sp.]
EFSLFPLTAEATRAWASELPVTSTLRLVQHLLEAIDELNQVAVAAELRHIIMETLQPSLLVARSSLSRRFINQPLVLPPEPQHMADLAEQLFRAAGTAYTLVAVHAIRDRESIHGINPARLVCESLQRALYFNGCRIFQRYQLYQKLEPGCWQTLHQLYAFAERQQLTRTQINGLKASETTITATYLRPLLLACCKPNQLRQSDLAAVFRGLEEWSGLAEIDLAGEGLFGVDLNSDRAPAYAGAVSNREATQLRIIATGGLVARLRQLQDESGHNQQDIVFENDIRLHHHIIQHVANSLSSISMRNFNRSPFRQQLWVALGLGSTHFHCAGKQEFDQVIHGPHYKAGVGERKFGNPFLERKITDHWEQNDLEGIYRSEARTGATSETDSQPVEPDARTRDILLGSDSSSDTLSSVERFPLFSLESVNVGPGGYCLRWPATLPGEARSGDILCVREHDSSEWSIATIRWTDRLDTQETMVGIDLLSPRATAYGASIRRQKGAPSEAIRVLMLPEIALVAQPRTLITPRTGFHERL